MSDLSLEALLRSLPDRVDPPPAFERALRARLAAELVEADRVDSVPRQEVTLVDLQTERPDTADEALPRSGDPRRRPNRKLLGVAAVALLVAAFGVAVFVDRGSDPTSDAEVLTSQPDRDVTTSEPVSPPQVTAVVLDPEPVGPPRSFVGGDFESFTAVDQVDPYRVVATADHVWTMSLDGTLVRRDPVSFAETARLQVAASSMLAADATSVWIGDVVDGTVKRIDPATAEVVAVIETGIATRAPGPRQGRPGQVPGAIAEMEFARLGDLDAADGSVWVTDLDGRLLQIDAAAEEVVAELAIDTAASLVRAAGRFVLLGDQGVDEGVVVLDVTTGQEVARHAVDLLIGADLTEEAAYVFDQRGVLARIDLASGDVQESDSLGAVIDTPREFPFFPHRPAVSRDGLALVTTRSEALAIDPTTLEVVARQPANGDRGMLTIGPDGTAWIVEHTADIVHRWTSSVKADG